VFKGTIKQCLDVERNLRPTANIGWNKLPGGLAGHANKGVPKSPEHREKIRQASLKRWANPKEKKRMVKIMKQTVNRLSRDRTGSNNPNFGKTMSEETKQKIRDRIIDRGGYSGKRNPNYRHGQSCQE
jgi:hypothetical protein